MKTLTLWLTGYLLNSLWMVPVVFAFARVAARWLRRAGPQVEHGVWVSALLLETILPACRFHGVGLWETWRQMWMGGATASSEGAAQIEITGAAAGHGAVFLPAWMRVALAVVYGCSLLYFVARLGWGWWVTRSMRRRAQKLCLNETAALMWERCCRAFGFESGEVEIAISSRIDGPVTVGIRRGVLLLPPGFADRVEESDLCAVMAHECAHMRRKDFFKNLLYSVMALPASYHPLLGRTLTRIAETREMICDAMAAEAIAGRESYARSLLRLAAMMVNRAPARTLHAIGIFDANSFERRVMSLTGNRVAMGRARRMVMIAVCAMAGAIACGSAMALRMEVGARETASTDSVSPAKSHAASMPQLIYARDAEYPKVPKADRIKGVCVVMLTVDREGMPQDVHVVKSLRPEYDQKAIEAVQQYRFKPALQDGQPVEKILHVEVNFQVF